MIASALTVVVVTVAASIVSGCSAEPAAQPQASARTASNPLEVTAPPHLLARLNVAALEPSPVMTKIAVPARVEVDQTRTVIVGSPVLGRVVQLLVLEGEKVLRGQVLGVLHSRELAAAQQDFLKALANKQLAARALERAHILLAEGVISAAEFHRREVDLAEASAELGAARDYLTNLGLAAEAIARLEQTRQITSALRLTAPIDGTLLDRKVTVGQVVQPGDALFEISDLSSVWVVADVAEQYAEMLFPGQQVEAQVAALNGTQLRGVLSFVSATVNPETRTIRVRMDVSNPEGKLKPAMMATMFLQRGPELRRVLPMGALVREGNKDFTFVRLAPDTFVLRPVSLGEEVAGGRVLLSGIEPNEQVVLDGAFHLNNERRQQKQRAEGS